MSWICSSCFFQNEDGDRVCTMCSEPRTETRLQGIINYERLPKPMSVEPETNQSSTASQERTNVPKSKGDMVRYVVNCPNSGTKTIVESMNITEYYCRGCGETHPIDDLIWVVEQEDEKAPSVTENKQSMFQEISHTVPKTGAFGGDHLILEDVATHYIIEVGSEGGVLGRYGTLGAAFLQNDPRGRMVSGEHCRFKFDHGRWSIEHLSRTNDTEYNGRKLEHGYEEGLRDGKVLTLANAISFNIRIF